MSLQEHNELESEIIGISQFQSHTIVKNFESRAVTGPSTMEEDLRPKRQPDLSKDLSSSMMEKGNAINRKKNEPKIYIQQKSAQTQKGKI